MRLLWFSSGNDETTSEGKFAASVGKGGKDISRIDVLNGSGEDIIGGPSDAGVSSRNMMNGEEIILFL